MGRLIWWLAFAMATAIALAVWTVGATWDRHTTLARAEEELAATALLLEQHADRALEAGDRVVRGVVELAGRADFADPQDTERMHGQLRRLVAGSPQISSAWILDANGVVVAETWGHPPAPRGAYSHRRYFQAHLNGRDDLLIEMREPGSTTGRPRFTLSRPIPDAAGRFKGVAAAGVLSEYFGDLYRQAGLGPGSRLMLGTAGGAVLASWPIAPLDAPGEASAHVTVARTLARYPVRVEVAVARRQILASWRSRTAGVGGVALAVIAAFAGLTRMGLASTEREARMRADLQQANASLEGRVRERTERLARGEALLHRVLEHLPVGVGVCDSDGRFVMRNLEMERLGLGTLPALDDQADERWIAHGPDGRRIDRSCYPGVRALRGETMVPGIDFLHRAADGRQAWRRVSAIPLERGPDSATEAAAVVVIENIDLLKRSEAELAARLAELRAVYDTAPIGLCVLDRRMRFQRVNRRLAEMNGVAAEDHLGRHVAEVLPSLLPDATLLFRRVLDSRQPVLNHEMVGETPSQPGVERAWVEHWVPLLDDQGEVTHISVVAEEVTERRRAERELRDAHLRLTSVLAAAGAGTFSCVLPDGAIQADAGAAALVGLPAAGPAGLEIGAVRERIHPDDLPRVRARLGGILAGEASYSDEFRVARPDGSIRWLAIRGTVDADRVLHGAVFDVTAPKEAQERAVAREVQLRLVADGVPALIAFVGGDRRFRFVNRAFCDWFGRDRESIEGRTVQEVVGEQGYGVLRDRIDAALRGEPVRFEGPFRSPAGAAHYFETRYAPYVDPSGAPDGLFAFSIDLTEQKKRETELREAAGRLRLLIGELNHRVKNTLSTVQSIAWQTLRRPDVPQDAREAIEARLQALGRSHDLLARETWGSVELGVLAHEALVAFGVDDSRAARFSLGGPQVRVPPNVALALGMAFHELATNAVKYGALSSADGMVELRWHLMPGHHLAVTWKETGGPPVTPPTRRGFGTRLLQQGLAHALGGPVELDHAPDGLRCHIEFTLQTTEPTDAS